MIRSQGLHAKQQRGAALITVTIMSVVVVAILANIFYRHGIDVARSVKGLHGEQALLFALSGESWAMNILKEDDNTYDGLDEPWAIGLPILPVEGGSLSGQLIDLHSRININTLAQLNSSAKYNSAVAGTDEVPINNSPYSLLTRLSFLLELPLYPDQWAAVVDWMDPDDYPLPGGFEENDYLIKEPPYRTANKAMADTGELTLVEGFSPAIHAALGPYITALPKTDTKINVNTADIAVLMALHPNLDATAAENLMLMRPWPDLASFHESLELEAGLLTTDAARLATTYTPPVTTNNSNRSDDPSEANDNADTGTASSGGGIQLVDVQSNYFLLSVIVQLGTNTIQLDSVLYRAAAGADVLVLERTIRYLPKTAAPLSGADDEELESTTTDS